MPRPLAGSAGRQQGERVSDRRLAAVAGVAIAVAVVTVGFSGWRWTQAQGELARLEKSTVKVVTVTRDVAPGEVLTSADLTVASVLHGVCAQATRRRRYPMWRAASP